jgi:acyl carrier protein
MPQSSTLEQIKEIISDLLDLDGEIELTPDMGASDVPGWDSLANVSIVFAIEEEFGIELSAQELKALASLGDLARTIDEAVGLSRAA